MNDLSARLDRLESQLGRWKAITLALVLMTSALWLLGARNADSDTLTARQLELVDDQGRTVIRLRAWPVGGLIEVMNVFGETTTWIGQTADANGVITISTRDGRASLGAGALTDAGHGFLALFSREGRLGLKLQGGRDSRTGGLIALFDDSENEIARLDGDTAGMGRLQLKDEAAWRPDEPR